MKRLVTLKRHIGLFVLGLLLTLGTIGAQAVGASNVTNQPPTCAACQPQPPQFSVPKFTKVRAWRAAGGMVDVQVEVENATSVNLIMPGNVMLNNYNHYDTFDVYHFHVTGLTPNQFYNFEVDAHGYLVTVKYYGSVQA